MSEHYRDYIISHHSTVRTGQVWEYAHKDYDGPEDRRIGWAGTIDEAKGDIDAIYEDAE